MTLHATPGAARWSYAARVMTAHLTNVIRCQCSQPGELVEGIHLSISHFFRMALEGIERPVPRCDNQTLALARDTLQLALDPPPRTNDALYDRLRAYAHVMSRLCIPTQLTSIEIRDARELLAFLQCLGRDGNAAPGARTIPAHMVHDTVASR